MHLALGEVEVEKAVISIISWTMCNLLFRKRERETERQRDRETAREKQREIKNQKLLKSRSALLAMHIYPYKHFAISNKLIKS